MDGSEGPSYLRHQVCKVLSGLWGVSGAVLDEILTIEARFPQPVLGSSRMPKRERRRVETEMMLRLARSQHGVVSRRQLLESGFADTLVDEHVRALRLIPVFTGVYGLGHDLISHRGWWAAALLSAGPGAALSHASAADCWGLIEPRQRIEVVRGFNREPLSADRRSPNRKLLIVHRSRYLPAEDLTLYDGFPVTTVARTFLNLSAIFPISRLESAIAEADRRRILDWTQLNEVSRRGTGWKGIRKLRSIIEMWNPGLSESKSKFERRFLRFCRDHLIPTPEVNVMVEDFEVDCLWSDRRLVIELDSFGFHRDRRTFESDRRRDVVLRNAGYEVHRLTYRQFADDPGYVLDQVLRRIRT